LARRDLAAEIDADALPVRRVWARTIVRDPGGAGPLDRAVVVRVDAGARPDVVAWLSGAGNADCVVCTDWLPAPARPELVLIGAVQRAVEPVTAFRFNLRFSTDRYRRHLEVLAGSGLLGLTTAPLRIGDDGHLESPCVFVPVQREALRTLLREIPPAPVV
jgi:hypothetical protein